MEAGERARLARLIRPLRRKLVDALDAALGVKPPRSVRQWPDVMLVLETAQLDAIGLYEQDRAAHERIAQAAAAPLADELEPLDEHDRPTQPDYRPEAERWDEHTPIESVRGRERAQHRPRRLRP